MARLEIFENLPIGGKIWLGFSLTTALFLVVTWLYHGTLFQALSDYEQLLSVSETRKSHLQHIHRYVLEARRSEKDFLAHRRVRFAEEVDERVDRVLAETAELEKIEEISGGQRVAAYIRELTQEYRHAFSEVVSAWRTKGLDHESGLQGRFRRTIHAEEDKARNFKTGALYLTLLQIRRSEKDTGLRRSQEYVDRTHDLIRRFIALVAESDMEETVKSDLTRTMGSYREQFDAYARGALAGAAVKGGVGAYREAAHAIERILVSNSVPDFEEGILMLRRSEKDYLLRGDKKYVEMVRRELRGIRGNISASGVSEQEKAALSERLDRYERDFLSLVAQNDRIDVLQARMKEEVEEIEALVEGSVQIAVAEMARLSAETKHFSAQRARYALVIAFAALALVILFAEFITRRITRPLSTLMALTEVFSADAPTRGGDGSGDEVHALARAMGEMNRNINGLFSDLGRTAGILKEVCGQLGSVSGRLRRFAEAAGGRDEAGGRAHGVPNDLSFAIGELRASSEKIGDLARSLRVRADDMVVKADVQKEMLAGMMARSK